MSSPKSKGSPTHRLGITEQELQATVSLFDSLRNSSGLDSNLTSLRRKMKTLIEKILDGDKVPDYIPNGKKKESKINLESLGFKEEEIGSNPNNSNNPNNSIIKRIPHEPTEEEFAEADALLAAEVSKTPRMSEEEWQEQRKKYPFLPEIQP